MPRHAGTTPMGDRRDAAVGAAAFVARASGRRSSATSRGVSRRSETSRPSPARSTSSPGGPGCGSSAARSTRHSSRLSREALVRAGTRGCRDLRARRHRRARRPHGADADRHAVSATSLRPPPAALGLYDDRAAVRSRSRRTDRSRRSPRAGWCSCPPPAASATTRPSTRRGRTASTARTSSSVLLSGWRVPHQPEASRRALSAAQRAGKDELLERSAGGPNALPTCRSRGSSPASAPVGNAAGPGGARVQARSCRTGCGRRARRVVETRRQPTESSEQLARRGVVEAGFDLRVGISEPAAGRARASPAPAPPSSTGRAPAARRSRPPSGRCASPPCARAARAVDRGRRASGRPSSTSRDGGARRASPADASIRARARPARASRATVVCPRCPARSSEIRAIGSPSVEPVTDEPAADHGSGATDAAPAVHVGGSAVRPRTVDVVEDPHHVARGRCPHVGNRVCEAGGRRAGACR